MYVQVNQLITGTFPTIVFHSFAKLSGVVVNDATIAEYVFNPAKIMSQSDQTNSPFGGAGNGTPDPKNPFQIVNEDRPVGGSTPSPFGGEAGDLFITVLVDSDTVFDRNEKMVMPLVYHYFYRIPAAGAGSCKAQCDIHTYRSMARLCFWIYWK